MKKYLVLFLAVVMTLAFTACSGGGGEDLSDSKYVGTWVADSMHLGDEAEDFAGGEFILTLNDDGTGSLYSISDEGEEETSEITWQLTDGGFKTKGDTKMTFTDDGDNIKTKILGVDLVFVKGGEGSEDVVDHIDASVYGYDGEDPVVGAVYEYLSTEVSKQYEDEEATEAIPIVNIVATEDGDDGDIHVWGDFWINNYKVNGDTLECTSGGAHPGLMHVVKNEDGTYSVASLDQTSDGSDFEESARNIFGDRYDKFIEVQSDDTAREELRKKTVETYVKANNLEVTKYQDYGWDPVELSL